MGEYLHRLPLHLLRNRWAAFAHDLMWVPVTLWLAYSIRFNFEPLSPSLLTMYVSAAAMAVVVQGATFYLFGLYRGMWRFASIPDLVRILQAVFVGAGASFLALFLLNRLDGVPRSVLLLYPLLLIGALTGPRLMYRWFKDHSFLAKRSSDKRALIIGAGKAGEMLVRDLVQGATYQTVGFVDDDPDKLGREIHGIRVLGKISDLEHLAIDRAVDTVIIAMPSAASPLMRRIVETCTSLGIHCTTLPSLAELADGKVEISRLREVDIEDLLGRETIDLDNQDVNRFLSDKRVLVTGAGGSIGSELCRQVAEFGPAELIMLDNGEFNLYQIEQEMEQHNCSICVAVLGDVRDKAFMRTLFERYRPEVVLHAAAYKHVPLVEANAAEGVKTNILGTQIVADLAQEYMADKFVLVSTDKAVNPTNVMGATKRAAEIYCQSLSSISSTSFITTRFGNVLGSAGSVVPLFRKQIAAGGPVTVTHPDITRYFMTIPEAVSLILQAAAMGTGGEIFVLDMGQPVKIVDLAEQMIKLSGYEPNVDIMIDFVGLRPGEKLHEELFHNLESLMGTRHPKIMLAEARNIDRDAYNQQLQSLVEAIGKNENTALLTALKNIVPEYAMMGSDNSEVITSSSLH